ncbi:hypothetical protein FHG87_018750 [Trinorchestia longiramus]|nr:hypothetical protein FHG87_018750 [Trinorchestia longiramus]
MGRLLNLIQLFNGELRLSSLTPQRHNHHQLGRLLLDLINTNYIQQHVIEPRRRNNILNLVITTPDRIIGLEVMDKIGDHHMIDLVLEVHDPNTRTRQKHVLDYKRANFELMKEELGSIDYEVLMRNKNTEECYMIVKEKMAAAMDYHIPIKQMSPHVLESVLDCPVYACWSLCWRPSPHTLESVLDCPVHMCWSLCWTAQPTRVVESALD